MERVFSPGEFGLLVWNNLFVDRAVDGNKSVMIDGVTLMTKEELEHEGKEAYSIGSVMAVYELQYMLSNVIARVFGRALDNTRVWLLDERANTEENERILAMWDASLTEPEMAANVMVNKEKTKADLLQGNSKSYDFSIDGMAEGTKLSILVVPHERFLSDMRSYYPGLILALSLVLATTSQVERWIGHPIVISSTKLWQAKIEQELRDDIEPQILRVASDGAIAHASRENHGQYVSDELPNLSPKGCEGEQLPLEDEDTSP
jgi:hypothetical protein